MQREQGSTFEGPWHRLENLSPDLKGSIHDDNEARRNGFRQGFVSGSVVATSAMPGLLDLLGQDWMAGGWSSFRFITPVYVDEEVRTVGELLADEAELKVVTRDGHLCCTGRAGIGAVTPWDGSQDGQRGAESVFRGMTIGELIVERVIPPGEIAKPPTSPGPSENLHYNVATMLQSAGDTTPWYGLSSPWGGGIVPPEWLHRIALLALLPEGGSPHPGLDLRDVREPLIWAEHHLALAKPIFNDGTYKMAEWVADKGISGRTVFLTFEFEFTDESGVVAARGRHKAKWFPA